MVTIVDQLVLTSRYRCEHHYSAVVWFRARRGALGLMRGRMGEVEPSTPFKVVALTYDPSLMC